MRNQTLFRLALSMVRLSFIAFPREFRRRHGADALSYFEDRACDRLTERGVRGLAMLVLSSVVDTVRAGLAERRSGIRGGRLSLGSVVSDTRFGLRSLRKHPGFVVATATPIALGVAGVTAVFAVISAVVLAPLPYDQPEALVLVGRAPDPGATVQRSFAVSPTTLIDLEDGVPGLESIGGVLSARRTVLGPEPEVVHVASVTRQFMDVFRIGLTAGRTFAPAEFRDPHVALLSWQYWQRRWGGDVAAVGSILRTDQGDLRIIGILPQSWHRSEAVYGTDAGIWTPLDYGEWQDRGDFERNITLAYTVARLAPGTSIEVANEQLRAAAVELWREHPGAYSRADGTAQVIEARSLHAETVGPIGNRLAMLLAAVACILAIACANVANLFLARGAARQRELAMRSVLGAGRIRLSVQLLVESIAIAVAGGSAGLLLAYVSLDTLVAFTPGLPRADAVAVDLRVAAVALLVSVGCGVGFGMVPAIANSSHDPGGVLRGGRQPRRGADRLRATLVVGQTALALVLVACGGLMANSVLRLALIEPGFRRDGILTVQATLALSMNGSASSAFYDSFTERLSAIPGVMAVSGSLFVPGDGRVFPTSITHPRTGQQMQSLFLTVLPDFFHVLDIPIIEGRPLGQQDSPGTSPAAVVSRSLAQELWPGESPIGRTFDARRRTLTVVGVAADIRSRDLHHAPQPMFYESYSQNPWLPGIHMLIRYGGDVTAIVPAIRSALRATDPTVALDEVMPLPDVLAADTLEERHYALLLGVFSTLALAIAAVGIYATVSYTMARRVREMGIRRAVGARGSDVVSLVMRHGLLHAAAGAAIGTGVALVAARSLESLLFDITPSDPVTFIIVGTVLLCTALLACLAPAVRAARADPLSILKGD